MRKLSLMILGVLLGSALYAQDAKFGVMGGLNLSNITKSTGTDLYGSDYQDETYGNQVKPGLAVGVYGNFGFPGNDVVSLNPELYYSQLGSKFKADDSNVDAEINRNLHFLELPVLLKFNIERFHIIAGPTVSYLLSGKDKYSGEVDFPGIGVVDGSSDYDLDMDDFNRFTFGGKAGIGFDVTDNFKIFGAYNLGFTDLYKSDNAEGFNSNIQVGAGYTF